MKKNPKQSSLEPGWRTRRFLGWLALIALIALLLRLGVCLELSQRPAVVSPHPATDMATYKTLAIDILHGNIPPSFYYQPFYYAVFLPLVFALSATSHWGVILVQVLIGAASVWLAGLLGARLFGRRAGLLAAGILALARFHIFFTPYMLLEVLQGFWYLLTAWLVLRAYQINSIRRWALAALGLALTVLTRGNSILLLPGILLLIVWRNRHAGWKPLTSRAVLFVLLLYLPQLPFSLRNLAHFHRWTGPSTAEEAVLALGNTPEAAPGGLEYTTAFQEWMRLADPNQPNRTSVHAQILRWIRHEPLAWLELKFRMLLLYWDQAEIPNNIDFDHEAVSSRILHWPVLLDFRLFGALGLAGLALGLARWRRSPARLFLAYELAMGCLATVLFYVLGRFRLPLVPVIAIFAGLGVHLACRLVGQVRSGKAHRLRVYATVAVFAAAAGIVLAGFRIYTGFLEKPITRWVRPSGVRIDTPAGAVCYDHGPTLFGGWLPMELPEYGLRLKKEFVVSAGGTPGRTQLAIALPVLAPDGGRLAIRTELHEVKAGLGSAQLQEGTLELKASGDLQWFTLNLGRLSPLPERVAVELELKPDNSNTLLLLDTHRCYGRTWVLKPDNAWQRLESECCAELLLLDPATPRPATAAGHSVR